jgi:hypothetical protein
MGGLDQEAVRNTVLAIKGYVAPEVRRSIVRARLSRGTSALAANFGHPARHRSASFPVPRLPLPASLGPACCARPGRRHVQAEGLDASGYRPVEITDGGEPLTRMVCLRGNQALWFC